MHRSVPLCAGKIRPEWKEWVSNKNSKQSFAAFASYRQAFSLETTTWVFCPALRRSWRETAFAN
jgi:hypothetical protein